MRTRRSRFSSNPVPSGHRSVLLHEAVEALEVERDDIIVDATLGGAGHAAHIAAQLGPKGTLIGFDADEGAIERARTALEAAEPAINLVHANFREMGTRLDELGISSIDGALFDLGWSGYQLHSGKGFSFQSDEPLVMTYGKQTLTAHQVVNEWEESSLADIIFGWGEERYARRIASAIVASRPIASASALAEVIAGAVPAAYRHGRTHPATKSFQAIRIAVNDELGALEEGLAAAWRHLTPEGRIAVITFHSIEDRVVKRRFLEWEREGTGSRLTKKPITPSKEEIACNPRARSAKLRVIRRN